MNDSTSNTNPADTDNSVVTNPSDLIVRKMPFEFPDDINPHWAPDKPEWSQMANGCFVSHAIP